MLFRQKRRGKTFLKSLTDLEKPLASHLRTICVLESFKVKVHT